MLRHDQWIMEGSCEGLKIIPQICFLKLWNERGPGGVFEFSNVCDNDDQWPTSVVGDEEPRGVDMVIGTQLGSW